MEQLENYPGMDRGGGNETGPETRRKGMRSERENVIVRIKRLAKVGRNDPCPCGSGKKYKKCCGGPGRATRGKGPDAGQAGPAGLDWVEGDVPSRAEWKRLVQAASAYQRLAPWDWMWDQDIFGVRDPGTGEVLYCSVLGRVGVQYGLAAYVGSEGLAGLLAIQMGKDDGTDREIRNMQRALVAFLEPPGDLLDQDRSIVKASGVGFKKGERWPAFMDMTPGLYPWSLTSAQARALTVVLKQTCVVAKTFRNDPGYLSRPQGSGVADRGWDADDSGPVVLVRSMEGKAGPGGPSKVDGYRNGRRPGWRSERFSPPPPHPSKHALRSNTDFRIDRAAFRAARDLPLDEEAVWELDYRHSFEPVREGGARPFFPYVVLVIDHSSGEPLFAEVARESDVLRFVVKGYIASHKVAGVRPGLIRVRNPEIVRMLGRFLSDMGTDLEVVDELYGVGSAMESFDRYAGSARR